MCVCVCVYVYGMTKSLVGEAKWTRESVILSEIEELGRGQSMASSWDFILNIGR